MAKNIFSKGILNLTLQEFIQAFDETEDAPAQIIGSPSRLIPVGKKDDEMALTTVFLSAIKYIKEFRNMVSEPIKLSKTGNLLCFTEVSFPILFADDEACKKSRFDGLVLVVSGNKIKDAAIFEMKQGKNELEREQIERYLGMCKKLGIPRLVTITNQFVSKPTDFPIDVTIPKKCPVDLYHYAWMSLHYFANILLKKNDTNIADSDQEALMGEIFRYFEDTNSVSSYDTMSVEKWKEVVTDLASATSVKKEFKPNRESIVEEWIQEEKSLALDLSLLLSTKEFIQISCDKKKYDSLAERVKEETEILTNDRTLSSVYKIQNAVAPLNIEVDFQFKTIRIFMIVPVPTDKKPAGKIAFIRKYIKKAQSTSEKFTEIQNDVFCIIKPKLKKFDTLKYSIKEFLDSENVVIPKDFDFSNVEVSMEHDLGRDIQSATKFITLLESKVTDYYVNLMQYFEKWVPSTPKVETLPQDQESSI